MSFFFRLVLLFRCICITLRSVSFHFGPFQSASRRIIFRLEVFRFGLIRISSFRFVSLRFVPCGLLGGERADGPEDHGIQSSEWEVQDTTGDARRLRAYVEERTHIQPRPGRGVSELY